MLTATYIKKHKTKYSYLSMDSTRMTLNNYSMFGFYMGNFMDNF